MVLKRFADLIRNWQISEDFDPWWLDDVGHAVSGMIIGAVGVGLGFTTTVVIIGYFVLAGVWELYEYKYNIRPWDPREDWSTKHAIVDTITDTFDGLLGVLLVVFYIA